MKQILYGVGKSLLIDLKDETKVIGMGDLQDLTINSSAEEDEIHGGDTPYPITTFPKTKSVTISCQNATFDISMFKVSQGSDIEVGEVEVYEYFEYVLTKDELTYDPKKLAGQENYSIVDDSFSVQGFKKSTEGTPKKGEFAVKSGAITFAKEDVGAVIKGYYIRKSAKETQTVSSYADRFPTAFKFFHTVNVYDDDTQLCGKLHITIFKAKSDNNFEQGLKPETAYAPRLTLKALNPNRADKKLWDYSYEPIVKKEN